MCQLYCVVFVTIALFLAQGANASALSRQADPCSNYCMNGFNCSLISGLHCKCSWEYTGDRCEEKVHVLRYDFFNVKEMLALGNLRDVPELGHDGKSWIGGIKSNEEFSLSTTNIGNNGTNTCVNLYYKMENPGSALSIFTLGGSSREYYRNITKPGKGYGLWSLVRFTIPNFNRTGRFVIHGTTKNSAGNLYIDDVQLTERLCYDVYRFQ
ncbi:uncharacterized protein LOC134250521 [Saccostrea cucullata]|uniref:uncharacterized protein LOC134250521 n=1 Tax=Saccostrea cuccullata TaxID=36930 RepID=UPI002ED0A50F